ncbi:hypothetical protein [Sphingobacterium sp.]
MQAFNRQLQGLFSRDVGWRWSGIGGRSRAVLVRNRIGHLAEIE